MIDIKGIAHKKETKNETITEHGEKTLGYGNRFSLLNNFYSRLSNLFLKVTKDSLLELDLKKVNNVYINNIKDVLVYHDLGKVNTSFQGVIEGDLIRSSIQREHSIGSSAIYLYEKLIYLEKSNFSPLESTYLKVFIYLNSWVISRHHSGLNNYVDYINRLIEYVNSNKFKELKSYSEFSKMSEFYKKTDNLKQDLELRLNLIKKKFKGDEKDLNILLFLYVKLIFGFLCQSDYLATSDFMIGNEIPLENKTKEFKTELNKFNYKNSPIIKSITNNKNNVNLDQLNKLRLKVNKEVITTYESNKKDNSFIIEAMTGIGKTNISIDLALRIMENKSLKKMLYIFPYNAIVDQTKAFIEENLKIKGEIINSITPMELTENETDDDFNEIYLNRLMLNVDDGLLLTSHVNLGDMLFGLGKDSAINLINMTESLIIMDEIHSYNSDLWEVFLKSLEIYKDILGLELIYMSATMPNFSRYINVTKLVSNFNIYTKDPIYMNKFEIKMDLMDKKGEDIFIGLYELYKEHKNRKNLISFINKKDANNFYNYMKEFESEDIYLLTGDTCKKERLETIEKINSSTAILVIATQVIEVGVDIDMDVCYGNVRPASSLEQLLGRLNRNNKKTDCLFYLFNLSSPDFIYRGNYVQKPEVLLKVLKSRDYTMGYFDILQGIKDAKGIFADKVEHLTCLNYKDFSDGMKLIEDNMVSVYLNETPESQLYWNEYKDSLTIKGFGKRKVLVHNARVQLNDYIVNVPSSYVKQYDFESSYDAGYFVLTEKVWLTK